MVDKKDVKKGKKTVKKRVEVTKETETGRNEKFRDNKTKEDMTLKQFVKKIKKDEYPEYHIRDINGVETPVSNPDGKKDNNLD